ncbi:MAG: polymer-forming cytoskeletal protein [Gammaproteobacteria bacterium]|nr:polymer-forming cytoskeletal protein [Gammaproteobacteria bacterium]
MWSRKQKSKAKPRSGAADTLITLDTKITGDVEFSGVLFVDGHIKGNITANQNAHSFLTIGAQGHIEGEVRVPQVMIYGFVKGDVHAYENLNMQKESQVEGNVYYNLLEMAMGAAVNGKLVKKDTSRKLLNHKPEATKAKAAEAKETATKTTSTKVTSTKATSTKATGAKTDSENLENALDKS